MSLVIYILHRQVYLRCQKVSNHIWKDQEEEGYPAWRLKENMLTSSAASSTNNTPGHASTTHLESPSRAAATYCKTGWLGPLGWLGPNLKTTFKPQIYQFLYLVVKDLKKTPDFLSTKSQIWFNTDKSKILPLFTEIWPLLLRSYFPVPESRND